MKSKIEKRACCEVRASNLEDGTPSIEGVAVKYNSPTELWEGFFEVVRPGAFKRTLDNGADIRGLFNHNPDTVWGRTKSGTLKVWEDEEGLKYSGTINPKDSQALAMHAKMMRGDIDQSSFAFDIPSAEGERFSDIGGGRLREVIEARLYDVSPVTYPAYKDSESQARVAFRNSDQSDSNSENAQDGEQDDAANSPAQESHLEDAESANQEEQAEQEEQENQSDEQAGDRQRLRLELMEGI